ncbi:MAG: ATP-dependent zinc metalloprotease FtsH [Candidatus Latescibacterota bacterium]|jgi:cell division protease FtsH
MEKRQGQPSRRERGTNGQEHRTGKSGPGTDEDRGRRWRRPSRTQTFWILFVLGLILAAKFLGSMPSDERVISYKEYRDYLKAGQIVQGVVVGQDEFHGVLRDDERFTVNLGPIDAATKLEWEAQGLDFRFKQRPFQWYNVLLGFLPWLLMIAFWIFMLRQMQGGPRGLFSFGKSRARLLTEDKQKTTFRDVAGADEAKQELEEIIEFLKDPHKFQRLGGRIPKGVLMVGPPGTGKTHLARAVAGEAGVPFYSISGSDFVEMFVGVGASRVRDLFEQGKANAPCIIFIDEIDAVGRHRGAGIGGGHDEREQTLNQLLVEMDGFESNDGVILIAATNRPDVLDPALLRPGRFDRRVVVDLPDVRGREGVLRVHVRNVPIGDDVDLRRVAQGSPGLSGADLANLVNEAALLASRRGLTAVSMADFEEAKDKVMLGAERRSLVMTEEDKRLPAYHEAGHALVAKLLPGAQPIHKATIIPRGQAMGMVSFLADERRSITETRLRAHLATALGGCCAEKLIFSERSTGAQGDYKQVTALARSMVCDWGMNRALGPLSLGGEDDEIFVGREFTRRRAFSDHTAEAIDQEVRELVLDAERVATELLRQHEDRLRLLAGALLEFEVLDDLEIDRILAGEPLARQARSHRPEEQAAADATGTDRPVTSEGAEPTETQDDPPAGSPPS